MPSTVKKRYDIALSLALLIVCGVLYAQTYDIEDPGYESMGAAFAPRMICIALTLLALTLLGKTIYKGISAARAKASATGSSTTAPSPASLIAAVGTAAILAGYVAVLQWELAGYRLATMGFFISLGALLSRLNRRLMPIIVGLALALSFGLHYVFINIFGVTLPEGF